MKGTGEVFRRMDTLMKQNGKMEKELIEYLGLRAGTFSEWRRGNGYSYMLYIKEICDFLHVTPNYLFLGEDVSMNIIKDYYTKDERELIDDYRNVGVKEKGYVRTLVQAMKK